VNPISSAEGTGNTTYVVPCDLVWFKDKPLVGFAEVTSEELLQPFWRHTVKRRQLVALRPLEDIPAEPSHYRVSGMIFHMGRCGSTLLSSLLSVLPGVYVLRESILFFSLTSSSGSPADKIRWIRHLLAAYGSAIGGDLRHLVVKWQPFFAFHTDKIAAAFPNVPAVFLHRDPVEVLVSLCESPPQMNNVFQAEWFPADLRPADFENCERRTGPDMTARIIGAVCEAACAIRDGRTLDYRSLPAAAWDKVAPFFGLEVSGAERRQMEELSKYHSKNISNKQEFKNDSEDKQVRADAALRSCARRFVEPKLERLKRVLPPL